MSGPEILDELWNVIQERALHPNETSYTSKILTHRKGIDKALEKVGEESTEFILAVKNQDKTRIAEEAADLVYHLMIALKGSNTDITSVWNELAARRH